MKPLLFFRWLLFCSALLGANPSTAQADLLIKNVSIIDVEKGRLLSAQDVYIIGEKIVQIQSSVKGVRRAKQIVDGTGKYLIPGLWDMHTHNWWQQHFSNAYIANGVLGVRNMYTPMALINPLKDSIAKGLITGPHYYAAGRVIEGPGPEYPDWLVVDTKEKIEPALDTLQMEGSDFVKVYNKVPRSVYFDLVKAAQKRGLSVQGHLPMEVGALEASAAGQKSFEHLLGMPDLCTSIPLFKNRYKNNWFNAVMREDDYAKLEIDESLALKQFAELRRNKTWVCPTLVIWNNYMHPDMPFEQQPVFSAYTWPADMKSFWQNAIGSLRKRDAAYKAVSVKKYENLKRVVQLMYQAGVPMLTGTDVMNPFCYPGFSLHQELQLLKECGIPDAEVLKMATYNAAKFLQMATAGQVKAGFTASMVLLDKNPLEDIRHTQSIQAVVLKGRFLDQEAIGKLIRQ
jgi:imidazolonepropionase-like amidohydrolase